MTNPAQNRVAATLRDARKRLRLTQREVADAVKCSQTLLSSIELGERPLVPSRAAPFARVLQLDPAALLAESLAALLDLPEGSFDVDRAMLEEVAARAVAHHLCHHPDPLRDARVLDGQDHEGLGSAFAVELLPLAARSGGEQIDVLGLIAGRQIAGGDPYTFSLEPPPGLERAATWVAYCPSGGLSCGVTQQVWDRAAEGHARSRFAVAHLIGHMALHRSSAYLVRPHVDEFPVFRRGPFSSFDRQADLYAAGLLVPTPALRAYLSRQRFAIIDDIARHFGVGRELATHRLCSVASGRERTGA